MSIARSQCSQGVSQILVIFSLQWIACVFSSIPPLSSSSQLLLLCVVWLPVAPCFLLFLYISVCLSHCVFPSSAPSCVTQVQPHGPWPPPNPTSWSSYSASSSRRGTASTRSETRPCSSLWPDKYLLNSNIRIYKNLCRLTSIILSWYCVDKTENGNSQEGPTVIIDQYWLNNRYLIIGVYVLWYPVLF